MSKTTRIIFIFALMGSLLMACSSGPADAENASGPANKAASPSAVDLISGDPQNVPIPGMVTMVDVGAHSCVPCKMMTPIIEELSREYEGRAAIAFIDVWVNRDEIPKYAIQSIPTQIFYDAEGAEKYRHVGFLSKEAIVLKLTELGVQ